MMLTAGRQKYLRASSQRKYYNMGSHCKVDRAGSPLARLPRACGAPGGAPGGLLLAIEIDCEPKVGLFVIFTQKIKFLCAR